MTQMTRRGVFVGAMALTAFPHVASALTEGQARKLVDDLVSEINGVISSGKSEKSMYTSFEKIFKRFADTSYLAAYAMGNDGRRASKSQKKAFSKAFTGYISRRYGGRFREFIGGRLEVKGVRKIKHGFEVKTTAFLRGESPFEVTFLINQNNRMYNMFIEGVNMLLTERSEIGAMLDKRGGNIDKMIADLKKAR